MLSRAMGKVKSKAERFSKNVRNKKTVKMTANKSAKRSAKTSFKKVSRSFMNKPTMKQVRSVIRTEAIDKVLLKMATKHDEILKQIELGKKRLDSERRLALDLGTKILTKAKKIRDSLKLNSKISN